MRNFDPLTRTFSTNLMANFNENQLNEILSVSTEDVRIKLANLNPQIANNRFGICMYKYNWYALLNHLPKVLINDRGLLAPPSISQLQCESYVQKSFLLSRPETPHI
jgi:hypothetical protein